MTNSKPESSGPSSPKSNRGLVILLVCAIFCVIAFGFKLLTSGDGSAPTDQQAPASAGSSGAFYMPAEFEPQEIIFLAGEQLAVKHPDLMVALVEAVHRDIPVTVLASRTPGRGAIDSLLVANGLYRIPVETLSLPEISMWIRDYGPLTVTDPEGRRSMAQFGYEGERGTPFDNDVSDLLAMQLELALLSSKLQVEGGDLVTNGNGFAVMSTRAIDRNVGVEGKAKNEIVQAVAALLGLETVMLVPPLVGESTGHADRFITFLAADLVLVGSLDETADTENAQQLDKIAKDLEGMPTLQGPLRVERIDQPDHTDGIWRSYTSIVLANGVVLVPVYTDYCPDLDEKALAVYRRLFPGREIVPINASKLALQNGTLRGITLNVPVAGPMESSETGLQ